MLACTVLAILLFAAGYTAGGHNHDEFAGASVAVAKRAETSWVGLARAPVIVTIEGTYKGLRARTWAYKYQQAARDLHRYARRYHDTRQTLMSRGTVTEAINLAATVYGHGVTLWALARCESQLNPTARNASGSSGLMQFMPSTSASTPYGRFSIWSPYANALAAGWMLEQGRRSEWVC